MANGQIRVSDNPMLQNEEDIESIKQGKSVQDKILEFGDDDIVIVRNKLKVPFRFKYEGGLYELDPGEQTQLPGFMAWHFLKKYADYYYRQVDPTPANLKKARARDYQRNDPLFADLIVTETKIKKPVDAESRGKVIKLDGDSKLDDAIKGDAELGNEDQVLPERQINDEVVDEQAFENAATDQDKSIDEFNQAKKDGKVDEFKEKKESEAEAKKSPKAKKDK